VGRGDARQARLAGAVPGGERGLPVEDGFRLVPITAPTLSPYQPNWEASVNDALQYRPELVLVPADPVRVCEEWEGVLQALEGIGAAVEPARPGLAYFEAQGLSAIHGTPAATLAAARAAILRPTRIGAAPTRFCALACALAVRSRRPLVLGEHTRRWLGGGRSSCSATASRRRRCRCRWPAWCAHARRLGRLGPDA
jgi:hypothetical protein